MSGLTILFVICVTFLSAVFRLKCATNRAVAWGLGVFPGRRESFVERLAGEDACLALGLELPERLGADRLFRILCCMMSFSCSVLPGCPFLRSQLPGRLTPRLRLGLCLTLALDRSLGLVEAPFAPIDGTWTGRFQKKPKKRLPANAPRGKAIRGG